MIDNKDRVHRFLDKEIGVGSGCNFNDYADKESILNYAIELVEERNDLTCGCGVGPLMDYIISWVDEFEQEIKNQSIFKYEQKLIDEIKASKFFEDDKGDDIQRIANYLYSKEGQTAMLEQALEQIKSGRVKSFREINFLLKEDNELGSPISQNIRGLDKGIMKYINEYINKEFILILEQNISQLIYAFNSINDLKDMNTIENKIKI